MSRACPTCGTERGCLAPDPMELEYLTHKSLSDKYRAAYESYMTGLAMFRSSVHGMSTTESKAHESAFMHGWNAQEDAGPHYAAPAVAHEVDDALNKIVLATPPAPYGNPTHREAQIALYIGSWPSRDMDAALASQAISPPSPLGGGGES